MSLKLQQIGIKSELFKLFTIKDLIKQKVIDKPLDGNHGEMHPKGNDFVPNGIPFIMAADIINGLISYNSCKHIEKKQADSLRKGFSVKGDVLLTHKATIGRTAIVDYDDYPYIMLTPQVTYYRVKDYSKLNNKYLKFFFECNFFQKTLNLWAGSGSTRAYLGITEQQKLPVILPPLPIQKKIAAILSAYDELIENNNRRIAILEKMAEEIYREWFVRMRFPGHERVKVIKGVPEGWEIKEIQTLGKIITGKTPLTKISKYYNGNYFFIKTPDMHNHYFIFSTEETLTEDGMRSQPSQTIPPNSICVSCIGTGGVVSITTSTCQTNQQINSIILKNKKDLEWAFFTIKSLKETIKLFGATGTTMTNLSKGKFSSIKIIVPSEAYRIKYHESTNSLLDKIRKLSLININLKQSRDMLLPRLISGKLDVEKLDIAFPPGMSNTDSAEGKEADAA